jgi:heme-degrading monooxygenase HmoA
MAVLVRMTAPGMTTEIYDKATEQLAPRVLGARGFVAHVAFVRDGEFHVSEIWDSQADFQDWYDNNVKPNVPGVEVELTQDVHNVIVKS